MAESRVLALLVGIDHYLPHTLSDGSWYPDLRGAVRDVRRMEAFLRGRQQVEEADLRVLTASPALGGGVVEEPIDRPSYERFVAAWIELLERANAGDQLLIHYSGHGGRAPTAIPEARGPDGLDECLVPFDIGNPGERYLRDIEIACLLERAARRGVFTLLILDCCHAGGASRTRAMSRGIPSVDRTTRPMTSEVASRRELAAVFAQRQAQTQASEETRLRGLGAVRAWSNDPRGYVMLAACRAHEQAYETLFAGELHGALTHWLLDSLETAGSRLTYRALHARLVGRIHADFPSQTPQMEGEADRIVLSLDTEPDRRAIPVLRGDPTGKGQVLLGCGRVHGLRPGARLGVGKSSAEAVASGLKLELREVGAQQASAIVCARPSAEARVVGGDVAWLIEPSPDSWRRAVHLLRSAPSPALDRLEAGLRARPNAFVELAGDEQEGDAFWVRLDEQGRYEIGDGAGQPLPHVPPLFAESERAEQVLIDQLIHLARYEAVLGLENCASGSELCQGLEVDIQQLQPGFVSGDRPRPRRFPGGAGVPEVKAGDWICLLIKNRSLQPLNLAVLNLQPDWAIEQVHPLRTRAAYELLEPGREVHIPLCAGLPGTLTAGVDVLKVFATVGPVQYDWLEQPAIDKASLRGGPLGSVPKNPLERLFATLAYAAPTLRSFRQPTEVSDEWWVEQRAVQVVGEPVGSLSNPSTGGF